MPHFLPIILFLKGYFKLNSLKVYSFKCNNFLKNIPLNLKLKKLKKENKFKVSFALVVFFLFILILSN